MKFSTRDEAHDHAQHAQLTADSPVPRSSPLPPDSRAPTVADLGEHALIERIRARVPPAPPGVLVGIGDDAAVVAPERNRLEVVTTDCLIEGVHFEPAWAPPPDIGYKAMAVTVSDLAAMGAEPRFALLSLALPPAWPLAAFDGLLDGLLGFAAGIGVTLVGGNIARSPGPLVIDLTAVGSVKPRRVLTRSGARPGDELYVSGALGGAAAGLAALAARAAGESGAPACERRHLRPEPRLRLGGLLGRTRAARACVDLSDGLADGLQQIARASDVGVVVDADAVPVAPAAREWFARHGQDALAEVLRGGEDYELLFAVPPARRRQLAEVRRLTGDVPITRIGRVVRAPGARLRREGRETDLPEGFVHFADAKS